MVHATVQMARQALRRAPNLGYNTGMKKPQNPKPRNEALKRAMLDKQRSNAVSPQRNKARYSRTDRRDTSWKNGY